MSALANLKPWHVAAAAGVGILAWYVVKAGRENPSPADPNKGIAGKVAQGITKGVAKMIEDTGLGLVDGAVQGLGSFAGGVFERINPFDQDNLANQFVLSAGRAGFEDPSWTLGGWIWDKTHPGFNPSANKYCTKFLGIGCGK